MSCEQVEDVYTLGKKYMKHNVSWNSWEIYNTYSWLLSPVPLSSFLFARSWTQTTTCTLLESSGHNLYRHQLQPRQSMSMGVSIHFAGVMILWVLSERQVNSEDFSNHSDHCCLVFEKSSRNIFLSCIYLLLIFQS